jgi:ribose transport system substrate-binding protein
MTLEHKEEFMDFKWFSTVAVVTGIALVQPARADDLDLTQAKTYDTIMQWAAQPLDTAKFKKNPPFKIGVSAGYLSNAWINFTAQSVRYEASLHPEIGELKVTDAGFNPAKQTADIEDLLSSGVDAILFWPVDEKAILPVLKKAADKGVVTVNIGYNFLHDPAVTANAYVNQWQYSTLVANQLADELHGKGKVVAMLPIAGSSAAVVQLAALKEVIKAHPGMELLSAEYGDWDRAKAKQVTENLLQRFPQIDGVFCPAGQMSLGVYEAFDEAGRLSELELSPGDDYNGWTKLVAREHKWGAVTSGLDVGREAVREAVSILKGEPAPTAKVVPTVYLDPAKTAKLAEPDRPDDWFATSLPAQFLPK